MKDDYVEMSATCFIESFSNSAIWPGVQEYDDGDHDDFDDLLHTHLWRPPAINDMDKGLISSVQSSQKFVLGDWESYRLMEKKELAATAISFMEQGIEILPYTECWLEWDEYVQPAEWRSEEEVGVGICKHVIVVRKPTVGNVADTGVYFQYFGGLSHDPKVLSSNRWWFSGYTFYLGPSGLVPRGKFAKIMECITRYPALDSEKAESEWWMVDLALACLSLMIFRETKVVERRPPAGLNAHRVKKGKVPFFSHHVVTIDPQRIVYEGGDGSQPGGPKRTSPRLHWRRGHVRTLSSGKKIGIPPSIIGAKGGGGGAVIDKTYRVKTNKGEEHRC